MVPKLRKRLWFGVMIVVAAGLAFAGPSLIAGVKDTASADGCCGMMGSAVSSGTCSMQTGQQGCAMLSGSVVSVDKRDGSVTVRIKPATKGTDAASKALSRVKVGDTISMALALNKDGGPISPSTAASVQAAKYVCPMHPEVTSDKPGKCPKCGMDLVARK